MREIQRRRLRYLGAFWLVATGLALEGYCSVPSQLVWESKELKLSAEPGRPAILAEFRFKNASDRAVTLTSIHPSCECMKVTSDRASYGPGEQGSIHVAMELKGISGRLKRSIAISTSGVGAVEEALTLAVDVREAVALSATRVLWKIGAEPREQRVTARTNETNAVVRSVECSDSRFKASLQAGATESERTIVIAPSQTAMAGQALIRVNTVVDGHARVAIIHAAVH
jgi:hypothetical protein